ncbi:EAL domain-containing protein [Vibrio vulnificus]|uniref:EAL domain-containing protein n=2 Tax=Vibrio vulnificus TaxID=672 RepID=UPI00102A6F85|nr:EAL domain-containing protein [Vibrio vulnificus]RZP73091.1 EAL domain-containing protein [Vibrio vulnificus]
MKTFNHDLIGRLLKGSIAQLFCAISALLLSLNAYSAEQLKEKLLLIYSYDPGFVTTQQVYEGLKSEISRYPIDVDIEFMDTKSLYTQENIDNFHQLLSYKISAKKRYDYIVTVDDNALQFALTHQHELFPQIPIVFLGVNNEKLARQQNENAFVTGIVEASSLEENIKLVTSLFEDRKTVHVITDGTISGQAELTNLRPIMGQYPALNWDVINLVNLTWDTYATLLRSIDARKGVVVLLSAFRDKENRVLSFDDSLELIVDSTKLPIIYPFGHGLGDGILGGVVSSLRHQGVEAGKIIGRLRQDEELPLVQVKSPNTPVFDYGQLRYHGVNLSLLPENSRVEFRTPGFIDTHSKAIISLLVIALLVMGGNIAYRHRTNKVLAASEKKLRDILDSIEIHVYLKDSNGRYLFANHHFRKQLSLGLPEVIGKTDNDLFGVNVGSKITAIDNKVIQSKERYVRDESHWSIINDRQEVARIKKVPLFDSSNNVYALCGVSVDLTEQRHHQKLLEQAAYNDPLTGLPNRLQFIDKLTQAMNDCHGNEGGVLHLACFDLDNFKHVNDSLGHDAGDTALKTLLNRVHQQIDNECMEVARFGGDEFYVLFHCDNPEHKIEVILDLIKAPVEINDSVLSVTVSAGVTRYPQEGEVEPEQLFRQSEQALFAAKSQGKNQIVYNVPESKDSNDVLRKERFLTAFAKNEFTLFYQPKVSLETGEVIGVEALVRWLHPEEGTLTPGAFLPELESLGLVKTLDDWVLDTAIHQISLWKQEGIVLPVSVNLSSEYFRQANLVEKLSAKLKGYPNDIAALLEIEIVETYELDNLNRVAELIRSCRELNVKFSLDDFGTGYSSLTYLQQLPVDTLKVDRSFVINMLTDQKDENIVEGILGFCKAFKLTAVAEGVETVEHGKKLKEMGYQVAQGFGIARPIPEVSLVYWLNSWTPPDEWEVKNSLLEAS